MSDIDLACLGIPLPAPPPQMDLPGLGTLQEAWKTLGGIPSASDMVAEFLNQAQTALAPVKRYLEMVQTVAAIVECITKIPDALMSLDPTELLDCFEKIHKAVMKILTYLPPLSYLKMGLDLCSFCIQLIDGILDLLRAIDRRIQDYSKLLEEAKAAGDQELQQAMSCGASELLPGIIQMADAMLFIKPAIDTLLEPLSMAPGGGSLATIKTPLALAASYALKAKAQIMSQGGSQTPPLPPFPPFTFSPPEQPDFVPFPPLGSLLYAMSIQREQLVFMYNFLAKILGGDLKDNVLFDAVFGSFSNF